MSAAAGGAPGAPRAPRARIGALHIYPVKSARGLALDRAELTVTGLAQDRRWMLVNRLGRCVTQRELPRLALLAPELTPEALVLRAPRMPEISLPLARPGTRRPVTIWGHACPALDEGDEIARWAREFLGRELRMVRFDPAHRRWSATQWTGPYRAETRFGDGFALLALSTASLAELNARLPAPLPMNRFRPNLVLEQLQPFDEDRIEELRAGDIRLRPVKPSVRCRITTMNQETGEPEGDEPLRTLRRYRYDAALKGVCFGQNVIVVAGAGAELACGQELAVHWKVPG